MNTNDPVPGISGEYWYGDGTFDESNLVSGKTDQFRWSGLADTVAGDAVYDYDILSDPYKTKGEVNDCNEVPDKYLYLFPACNACVGLNYAGFAEGWRLPSQRKASHIITTNCGATCGREYSDQYYCAPGRQLWDFGEEQCSSWKPDTCGVDQSACIINFDKNRVSSGYWSSTQYSGTVAWHVHFASAAVHGDTKSTSHWRVRCFLGQWP